MYICTIEILIITIIIKDLIMSFTFLDYYNNQNSMGAADMIEQKFFEKLFKNVLTFPSTYAIIKAQGKPDKNLKEL